jgi:hypothetical protein
MFLNLPEQPSFLAPYMSADISIKTNRTPSDDGVPEWTTQEMFFAVVVCSSRAVSAPFYKTVSFQAGSVAQSLERIIFNIVVR